MHFSKKHKIGRKKFDDMCNIYTTMVHKKRKVYIRKKNQLSIENRGPQFVLFMQTTIFSYKTKPNLQVKAKKTVCITSKLLLFIICILL